MKILAALLTTIVSISSWAETVEVIEVNDLVTVFDLRCVINSRSQPQGATLEERGITAIGNGPQSFLNAVPVHHQDLKIELTHKTAVMDSCDMETLDSIQEDAIMQFGHISANVKLTKTSGGRSFMSGGRCVQAYREELVLDLGSGVVLTSHELEYRDSTGCTP